MSDPRPAVFLDRDGTVVHERHFATAPAQLELCPGAGAAIRALNAARVPVVLVTNQSGVARGYLSEERLAELHARLAELLAAEGARVDLVRACPHHPTEGAPPYRRACACRKPAPGMLLDAARTLDLDLARSWIVGDAARDVAAGHAAGARAVLLDAAARAVRPGRPADASDAGAGARPPELVAPDLRAAVEHLLAGELAHSASG